MKVCREDIKKAVVQSVVNDLIIGRKTYRIKLNTTDVVEIVNSKRVQGSEFTARKIFESKMAQINKKYKNLVKSVPLSTTQFEPLAFKIVVHPEYIEAEFNKLSAEEQNDTGKEFKRDIEYFNGDVQLYEQEESNYYASISSVPTVTEDEAYEAFLSLFSKKFKSSFGEWEKQEEPTIAFKAGNSEIYNSYQEAVMNTQQGNIEIGATNADGKFVSVLSIPFTTDPMYFRGFINNMIKQGFLSGEKIKNAKGQYVIIPQGNTPATRMTSARFVEIEAENTLGAGAVQVDGDGNVIIKNVDVEIDGFREEAILVNYLKSKAISNNVTAPVSEKEENRMRQHFISLLNSLGFSNISLAEYIANFSKKNGNVPVSVEALADMSNNVVAFAEGKENIENLSEETAHIIVEAYNNQQEVENALSEIENTEEWAEWSDVYMQHYNNDVNKVKREILGKILAKRMTQALKNQEKNVIDFNGLLQRMFNWFKNLVQTNFSSTHKSQLEVFLKRATDIAQRKDLNSLKNKFNNLTLYSVSNANKKDAVIRKKTALLKLQRALDVNVRTMSKFKDGSVVLTKSKRNELESTIKKIESELAQLNDEAASANIDYGIDVAISTHSRQISFLKAKVEKASISEISLQDHTTLAYLKEIAAPVLTELRAFVDRSSPQYKKLSSLINGISEIETAIIAKDDGTNSDFLIRDVQERVGTLITQEEADRLRDKLSQVQKDVTGWTKWFSGLTQAGNEYLNWLSYKIGNLFSQGNIETSNVWNKVLDKANMDGWTMSDFDTIIKKDEDGNNTGYLLSKINYDKFNKRRESFFNELYTELLGEERVNEIKAEGRKPSVSDIADADVNTYYEKLTEWRVENENLPRPKEYYIEREKEFKEANLSLENRHFLNEISRRRFEVVKKAIFDGKTDYSVLSEADRVVLDEINLELKARKSSYDAETGEKKVGEALQMAEELQALDEIRFRKATQQEISQKFVDKIAEVERTQGRDAALAYLEANGGIGFKQEFWDAIYKGDVFERFQPVVEELDVPIAQKIQYLQKLSEYKLLVEKRREIIKQHATPLNPAEINTSLMSENTKGVILDIEQQLHAITTELNTVFRAYNKNLIPNTSTENTINKAYEQDLADSGLGELDFIKQHLTAHNKAKMDSFETALLSFNGTFLPKSVIKYFEYNYGIRGANPLNSIKEFLDQNELRDVLVEYGRSKVPSYYKRFAPEGYADIQNELKNGTTPIANILNDRVVDSDVFRMNARYEWVENKEDETTINEEYLNDVESGFIKPKLSEYADEEYNEFFGITDPNDTPTKNLKYYEMLNTFRETKRIIAEKYEEEGNNLNELPNMSKHRVERVANVLSGNVVTTAKEWWKDNVFNRVDDLQYGERLEDGTDLGGVVPKYYLRQLENKKDITKDLLMSYGSMLHQANLYKIRSESIPEVLAVQSKLQNAQFEGGKMGKDTNVAKQYKEFVDAYFYGIKSSKKMEVSVLGSKVDVSKVVRTLDRLKRKANTAFSIPIAGASALTSNINLFLEKHLSEHVNKKSVNWAYRTLPSMLPAYSSNYGNRARTDKLYLLGELMGVHEATRRMENTSYGKSVRALTDLDYSVMTILSTPHVNTVMLAVLDEIRFVDGKFVNEKVFNTLGKKDAWDSFRQNSLFNSLELNSKTNNLELKPEIVAQIGEEQAKMLLLNARNKIELVNGNIDGMISPHDKSMATRHYLINLVTAHKGWFTLMMDRKFKKRHFNYKSMQFEEGHYRSLGQLFSGIIKPDTPFKMRDAINTIQQNIKDMDEVSSRNLKRVSLELTTFFAASLLTIAAAGFDDDDENKEEDLLHLLSYIYYRTTVELASNTPLVSIEVTDMVAEPFMIVSTIRDLKKDVSLKKVSQGVYEGMPKWQRGIIKQTYLKNYFQLKDIKSVSDFYVLKQESNLWMLNKYRKSGKKE